MTVEHEQRAAELQKKQKELLMQAAERCHGDEYFAEAAKIHEETRAEWIELFRTEHNRIHGYPPQRP